MALAASQNARVYLVGYCAIDVLSFGSRENPTKTVGIGGVCTNVARVLGASGVSTTIYTPEYTGEFGRLLSHEFAAYNVDWKFLPVTGPLAVFTAAVDGAGELTESHFADSGVPSRTKICPWPDDSEPTAFLGCADLPLQVLRELKKLAQQCGSELWLISTSDDSTEKVSRLSSDIDFLSINLLELEYLTQCSLGTAQRACEAVQDFISPQGVALISMGSRGAIAIDNASGQKWYQPAPALTLKTTVGAGDVLTGALITERLRGASWEHALHMSVRRTTNYLIRDCDHPLPFLFARSASAAEIPPPELLRL